MGGRKAIKTKIPEIVDYWNEHVDESDLSVDFSEAHERCWRCGCRRKLERCHIVPDSQGGADEPSNLVLLCKRCHLENPNLTDPEIMWDWLKAYKVTFYDTFWSNQGLLEYKRIYGTAFKEEMRKREIKDSAFLVNAIENAMEKTSYHFGDPHLNAATLAGVLRMALKEYDWAHGLETEQGKGHVFSFEEMFFLT